MATESQPPGTRKTVSSSFDRVMSGDISTKRHRPRLNDVYEVASATRGKAVSIISHPLFPSPSLLSFHTPYSLTISSTPSPFPCYPLTLKKKQAVNKNLQSWSPHCNALPPVSALLSFLLEQRQWKPSLPSITLPSCSIQSPSTISHPLPSPPRLLSFPTLCFPPSIPLPSPHLSHSSFASHRYPLPSKNKRDKQNCVVLASTFEKSVGHQNVKGCEILHFCLTDTIHHKFQLILYQKFDRIHQCNSERGHETCYQSNKKTYHFSRQTSKRSTFHAFAHD